MKMPPLLADFTHARPCKPFCEKYLTLPLAAQTTQQLTQSVDNWKSFLNSAAWLYKYPFHEQVLIHAQRPDATACAPMQLWNSRFGRWVNKDAKGIAVIDDSGDKPRLKYLFDVSDTNARHNAPFRLWHIKPEYEVQVIKELQNAFGETGSGSESLSDTILGMVINAVSDNYTDYCNDFLEAATDGAFADMDSEERTAAFILQLVTGVSHIALVRLGIEPSSVLSEDDYAGILQFNSTGAINQLGTAVSDISELVLRQIERSVRSISRQQRGTLAKPSNTLQNEADEAERSDDDGNQLQQKRGLPDSQHSNGQSEPREHRQIRETAEEVPERESERVLQHTDSDERPDGASVGDRQDGAGTGRTDDGTDGADRERDREDESRESDALDSTNEQHSTESRGNGTERPDLRITEYSLFPTLEEQLQRIEEAEAQKLSAFSVFQADIDHELCRYGSGFSQGKFRIYKFFEGMPSNEAAVAFLKKEYGIGGHSHTSLNGESGFVDHDGKGLHFSNHNYEEKHTVTWRAVAQRLRELIALDRYLTEEEKAYLPTYEQELAERQERIAEESAAREALRAAAAAMEETRKNAEYAFSLGDTVQLGMTTYTILGYDETTVSLSDPKFPLLSEDMPRDVFEQRLRESPVNDRLIAEAQEAEPQPGPATETVEVIPAEENHLPYDVVIQTIRAEEHAPVKPAEKINFRITDDALGHGGPKAKFQMNINAIQTLKAIESEQRLATADEQEVLSRYVGWGGCADAFDETKENWHSEYAELKDLLTEEEYESARASVLNAHYTSPAVIKAIYKAIENMGFRTGNILEPSCGIGNFFGLLPESMAGSRLYGVELDSITGRIAKQLYQNANIAIQGYEATSLPDSFFDVAIGNVPFGDYGVADKRYDKNRFLIHDYFFAKTLDKVRPGGIIAFVTSSGTMDKKNPSVRKYIAQRADLLGAIRLPNNAFLANAGTGVVADILFLQKHDRPIEIEPDWIHLGKTDGGFTINQYFVDNPGMILGELSEESTQYGKQAVTVKPIAGAELPKQLSDAIANIHAEITEPEQLEEAEEGVGESIPADPNVRNFSFAVVDGDIYYRENSVMHKVELSVTAESRIKGMVKIRDCTRKLIEYQLEGYSDDLIRQEQQTLNRLYDEFTSQYGLLNSRANNTAFSDDSSYCLLCSLEVLDENGALVRKADMFSKRTIRQQEPVASCDTAADALAVSLSEKAKVDLQYMGKLTGKTEEQLTEDLAGIIFFNPSSEQYETADEYLSGDVRWKLRLLKEIDNPKYAANMEALEKVQPNDLTASEIDVRLGATWIPPEDIQRFVIELLKPAYYASSKIKVHYSQLTAQWRISSKTGDYGNVTANVTYGTKRINAYKIIEETLNLKDVRIFDTVYDESSGEKRVLNRNETVLAQQKQQLINDAFRDWIWKDPDRRDRLTTLYNTKFNSIRPREYDGSHIRFVGMNPEITLRPHQVNAVARVIYGGNTLLAHVVGAGKTFTMAASAMESKRLGLCQKSLFVVPNHLTEQWAAEFLQLYPSANILVATKKDFETRNRKKFCSRIATGDYDVVIIGHSQFEKIPMSLERQRAILQTQLDEIIDGISEAKRENAERFTIKQMEKSRRSIKLKLDKLNDQTRKDDVVTFEELGVDRLFVDEAHSFKNLFLYTKMRNVAGLSQTEALKSSDLFMKCRYMDELTGNRGIVFATGTPISNSMTEMYTMQRYLQYDALCSHGLQHFDAWASTFGETITAMELAPEGTGYRAKTRFARFYNLPELISMFKQVADVQTADMLKLPVPEAEYHNEVIKPSKFQKDMVASFSERAEKVRNGMVDATVDNMLKITNDGRKLALDQRLTDDLLPDDPESKVNLCLDNIHRIWESSSEQKSTQLVFCDLSTPHGDGKFNVYDDLKAKLVRMGVPETEIAFIHDAKTEAQKAALFTNVRSGNVRILLGSTAKMGAGTNVQKRLIAEHHLDIPWRPSDIEQREGRILRQGNENSKVDIFRYVTENTFDSYMWQTIESKQKFISQIMTSKSPVRSCEDVDETALSYAEIKALATGNPYIREKMDLEIEVSRLKLVKANYLSQKYMLEDSLLKHYPKEIRLTQERINGYEADIALYERHKSEDFPGMLLYGTHYEEKKEAGTAILEACKAMTSPEPKEVGSYRGFTLLLSYDIVAKVFRMTLRGELSHIVELGSDIHGNIQRMENVLESLPSRLSACEKALATLKEQMDNAKAEVEKPFEQEHELSEKTARLAELDALLNMDKRENATLDAEPEHAETEPIKTSCKER